jgi:hypothetical protein
MTETEILRSIQALSKGNVRLFRNNVGFDATNKVRYGLVPGSSDLDWLENHRDNQKPCRPQDCGVYRH